MNKIIQHFWSLKAHFFQSNQKLAHFCVVQSQINSHHCALLLINKRVFKECRAKANFWKSILQIFSMELVISEIDNTQIRCLHLKDMEFRHLLFSKFLQIFIVLVYIVNSFFSPTLGLFTCITSFQWLHADSWSPSTTRILQRKQFCIDLRVMADTVGQAKTGTVETFRKRADKNQIIP